MLQQILNKLNEMHLDIQKVEGKRKKILNWVVGICIVIGLLFIFGLVIFCISGTD